MKLKTLFVMIAVLLAATFVPLTASANCDPLSPLPSATPPPPAPPPPPSIIVSPTTLPAAYAPDNACGYIQSILDNFAVAPAGGTPTYLVANMYRLNFVISGFVDPTTLQELPVSCSTPLRINTAIAASDSGRKPLCVSGLNIARHADAMFTEPIITVTTTDSRQKRRVDIRDVHISNVNAGIKFDQARGHSSVYGGEIVAAAGATGIGVQIKSQNTFLTQLAVRGFSGAGGEGVRCEAHGCEIINSSEISGNSTGVRVFSTVTYSKIDHSKVFGNDDHIDTNFRGGAGILVEGAEPEVKIFDVRANEVVELDRHSNEPLEFQGTPSLVIPALAAVRADARYAGRVEFYKSNQEACNDSDPIGQGCAFTSGPKGILRSAITSGAVSIDPWQGLEPQPDDLNKPLVAVINIEGGRTTSFTAQMKIPGTIFVSPSPINIATSGGAIDGTTTEGTTVAALTGTETMQGMDGMAQLDGMDDEDDETLIDRANIETAVDPTALNPGQITIVGSQAPTSDSPKCGLVISTDRTLNAHDVWTSLCWMGILLTLAGIGPVYARVRVKSKRRR